MDLSRRPGGTSRCHAQLGWVSEGLAERRRQPQDDLLEKTRPQGRRAAPGAAPGRFWVMELLCTLTVVLVTGAKVHRNVPPPKKILQYDHFKNTMF